jgi:hypothetical protein
MIFWPGTMQRAGSSLCAVPTKVAKELAEEEQSTKDKGPQSLAAFRQLRWPHTAILVSNSSCCKQ